jgi:hypothetical protein
LFETACLLIATAGGEIASGLHVHRERLLVIAYLSVVYAATLLIYLCDLYDRLREDTNRARILGSLVLVGVLHAVSDHVRTGQRRGRLRESVSSRRRLARDAERRPAALVWMGFDPRRGPALLIFVLVSSVILLRPETAVSDTPVGIR